MATHSSTLAWKTPWTEVGYSPWGRKESDTTEQLHFHLLSLRAMVREKFIALNSYFKNGERFKDNSLSLQFRTEKEK